MTAPTLEMKLSQNSLYFPLPFSNATIDNVVQIQNPLPVVPDDPKANVVAFKILSLMQQRYSVHPSVGFIGAGDHTTIVFSFNPEAVRQSANPADRELPTEASKDAIHIDFAVVEAASVATALARWVPNSRESRKSREVQADASAFWKQRGQVTANTATMRRVRLRCIFAPEANFPQTLVMRMEEEKGMAAQQQQQQRAAAVPKSRPPPSSATDPRSTAPPDSPPHRHSDTPRESTPRNDGPGAGRAAAAAAPVTTAATAAAARPPPPPPAAPASVSSGPAVPPRAAVKFPSSAGSGEEKEKAKALLSAVMNYKLSYRVAGALVLLTVLCGLFDRGNILTWLFSR